MKEITLLLILFILKAAESNVAGIVINYCPICGTKLKINNVN